MEHISKIFNKYCNTEAINELSIKKLRKIKNGIDVKKAIAYRFIYCDINSKKQNIAGNINYDNVLNFSRQGYDRKENNVPVKMYMEILTDIKQFYNDTYTEDDKYKLIAVDGTYNNDINMDQNMNMGIYDIRDSVPIDIVSYGKQGKNKEVSSLTNYITNNIHLFKDNVIVGDRCYFSYVFLNFLIENGIKFIVRVKV